jgi:phosphoglycerol transferase MdoB-like AlkP superfamily enzyme
MTPKKYLQNWIRGWLPKEPNFPSLQRATNRNHVRSRKIKVPIGMALFLSLFMINAIVGFFEANAMAALWLWFSCIIGLSLALDILVSRGKELNEKLVGALWLAVTNLGGILVNLHIFTTSTSSFPRILSLSVLALVNVPLLIALFAYVWNKKERARKLYRLIFLRG